MGAYARHVEDEDAKARRRRATGRRGDREEAWRPSRGGEKKGRLLGREMGNEVRDEGAKRKKSLESQARDHHLMFE
eukprot:CAMPEP_0185799876 /NCGR_PEP_ID=MMETSP1322-20130828/567_1 /TAXON_ID=265543 /ORGANISM="Minutocellus polymorphus, Strain RCC2270" /LENGTH=75 /DNA_ID=CAMNT_0028495479 /DNA_START=969 /DNA_END=1194 /DNA_ORIENTATION=-